jgi:hypothetical protein
MQMGKFGKWFCPNKMPDGSWCKGVPVQAQATAPYSQTASQAVAQPAPNGDYVALAVASIGLAQALYAGLGPETETDATRAAMRIYGAMKAMLA